MRRQKGLRQVLLYALAPALTAFAGCEEIDIPILVDEEEIIRYISESDEARELFRTSNLIADDAYVVLYDTSARYRDYVDSVRRTVSVVILADKRERDFVNFWKAQGKDTFVTYIQDFGSPFGLTKDAEAEVEDRFYVRTLRTEGSETTEYLQMRTLVRYGYFLKLGGDDKPFSGWVLRAYSGGGPTMPARMQVTREDNTTFSGDSLAHGPIRSLLIDITVSAWDTVGVVSTENAYIQLTGSDGIEQINDGESLAFRGIDYPDLTAFQTITAETDTGFLQQSMFPADTFAYEVTIKTPSNNTRLWNIVHLQEFRRFPGDTAGFLPINILYYKGWCVPYRIAR